jgi:glutathione peroxidase-family protein
VGQRKINHKICYNVDMKSIYEIPLNSAEGTPSHLDQFKGKVTLVVNTTVGCGNANQMEVLQWLQEKYQDQGFEIIAVPTNDYCGPGVTKGRWSQGITCGMDSKEYGQEVYGTTFKFSEMVSSVPNPNLNHMLGNELPSGVNGLGQETLPPHELYAEISTQMKELNKIKDTIKDDIPEGGFLSPWLKVGFYNGATMGGNFEKYLIDSDGYVFKHFSCTTLNYDIEKTLKESLIEAGTPAIMGEGRTMEVFNEEYQTICKEIERLIVGAKSPLNPSLVKI